MAAISKTAKTQCTFNWQLTTEGEKTVMGKWYLSILPMVLLTVGTFLRGKDADDKGPDDAIGKVLIAAAPVA
jgi:hypothetical protein